MSFVTDRRSFLGGMAALGGLALAGCGSPDEASPAANGLEKTDLKIGVVPVPDSAPLFIADQKGFFKAEGLNVKTEVIQSIAPVLPKMINGQIDAVLSSYVSFLVVQDKGTAKLKIFADSYQAEKNAFNLMVPETSKLKSAKDLKGAKIAVNVLRSIGELVIRSVLRMHALNFEDVSLVEVPFGNHISALKSGQVDTAWVPEPFITASQKEIGARVLTDTMIGPTERLPIAGWAGTEDWAKKHPNTMAALQRAIGKAQKIAASDRNAVSEVIPTYTKIEADVAKIITLGSFPTSLNAARIQRVADLCAEHDYIENKIDINEMIVSGSGK